ncbi:MULTISPECIES: nitrogenase component 1 [unclassified Adlercreutzia]|uniref:nitrogenase component 1 n=1 Tax=unclassified Adlercreutzia TaxID=2636013 RepID=UPI0013EA91B9|nr:MULTISPECIES: nitrogenase component 1 [unclassified Adlercreutzia]
MTDLRYRVRLPQRHRDRLRVPESHTLFVCPPACGRRHALRVLENDTSDDYSFCFLSPSDIALGDYERHLPLVVADLVARLPERPRVVTLVFNCVDDFLGTDEQALVQTLEEAVPGIRIAVTRVNPVSEGGRERSSGMQGGIYDLLEPQERHDDAITVAGRFDDLPATSEFVAVMRSWGVSEVRNVASCRTFDEYQRLASSALALSVSWIGRRQCLQLEQRLHMPTVHWQTVYDVDRMAANYAALAQALHARGVGDEATRSCFEAPAPALARARERAERSLEQAREAVGSRPVAVDSLATHEPHALAQSLADAGFNVVAVIASPTKEPQRAGARELERTHPEIMQLECAADRGTDAPRDAEGLLAVGADAAACFDAHATVDMFHDEGCFGFDGVARLYDALARAARQGRSSVAGDVEGLV